MTAARYTGWMRKGTEPGTIVAELIDEWSWVIKITGVRDAETGAYRLTGELGDPPANLRVPAIDGESA
jgi:hypothetical protein